MTSQTATRDPGRVAGEGSVRPSLTKTIDEARSGGGDNVDVKSTQTMAGSGLARDAETLLRALAGVSHVRVEAGPRGIDAIHVTAHDPGLAPVLASHVRSALLAGLATPILPARIHVRVPDADDAPRDTPRAPAPTAPRDRVRLLHDATEDETEAAHAPEIRAPAPAQRPSDESVEAELPGHGVSDTAAPRVVSIDVEHTDDQRVRCRVKIVYRAEVHVAEALAVDLPGAAAHAAAQATVRALADAGLHGLQLDGLREVEIAGRDHTIVALRKIDSCTRVRSGSAPVTGSPERAAALAAVAAARELL
jgi:hypothetical protein